MSTTSLETIILKGFIKMITVDNPIFFVGAGPGNPDLLTVKGMKILQNADIILYDALIDFEGFEKLNQSADWIFVGKRAGKVSIDQKLIGKLLVNYHQRDKKVVRLKGGDPTIFGRLTEELTVLNENDIQFEIIPGISAGLACAAELNTSLTMRNVSRSVCFVTPAFAEKDNQSWIKSVINCDTAVIYMGGKELEKISSSLLGNNLPTDMPVAIVENATLKSRKTLTTLNKLKSYDLKTDGPVCLIIGNIFDLTNTTLIRDLVENYKHSKDEKISYVA